jgi:hypothetical protein
MRIWRCSPPGLPSSFQPCSAFSCMAVTRNRPSGLNRTWLCAPFHSKSSAGALPCTKAARPRCSGPSRAAGPWARRRALDGAGLLEVRSVRRRAAQCCAAFGKGNGVLRPGGDGTDPFAGRGAQGGLGAIGAKPHHLAVLTAGDQRLAIPTGTALQSKPSCRVWRWVP